MFLFLFFFFCLVFFFFLGLVLGEDEAALCSDSALLTTMCDQLGLDENAVELALTRKVLVVHGEETETKLKLEQSEDVRDAAAKAIYSKVSSEIGRAHV